MGETETVFQYTLHRIIAVASSVNPKAHQRQIYGRNMTKTLFLHCRYNTVNNNMYEFQEKKASSIQYLC